MTCLTAAADIARNAAPAGLSTFRVEALDRVAVGVVKLVLVPQDGEACRTVEPGAHVDVHLPQGLVRQYSLVNAGERHRYVIAVGLDPRSRGASAYVHGQLRPGDLLALGVPRNNFALDNSDAPAVLVAGGIGITPLWSMAQHLERQGRPWTLYCCARSADHAAFVQEARMLARASRIGRVQTHFDAEAGGAPIDLDALLGRHATASHFYCCGPAPMLDAFLAAGARRGVAQAQLHVERFSAAPAAQADDRAFEVVLNSGAVHRVPPGRSILDVLLQAGESLPHSCREGICGSCETAVLQGEPLHRDALLSPAERASNRTMMICVSRARTDRLVLDI